MKRQKYTKDFPLPGGRVSRTTYTLERIEWESLPDCPNVVAVTKDIAQSCPGYLVPIAFGPVRESDCEHTRQGAITLGCGHCGATYAIGNIETETVKGSD